MDLSTMLLETLAPLSVALYVIGMLLKNWHRINSSDIPVILIVLGIAGAIGLMPIQDKATITEAIIQGILAAGSSVLANQIYKQKVESKP